MSFTYYQYILVILTIKDPMSIQEVLDYMQVTLGITITGNTPLSTINKVILQNMSGKEYKEDGNINNDHNGSWFKKIENDKYTLNITNYTDSQLRYDYLCKARMDRPTSQQQAPLNQTEIDEIAKVLLDHDSVIDRKIWLDIIQLEPNPPLWVHFLNVVNQKLSNIYNQNKENVNICSQHLIKILIEVLKDDDRTVTLSNNYPNRMILLTSLLTNLAKKPDYPAITPFSFYAFLFANGDNNEKMKPRLTRFIPKLLHELKIKEIDPGSIEPIIVGLLDDGAGNILRVTEMWLQTIESIHLAIAPASWTAFIELQITSPNKTLLHNALKQISDNQRGIQQNAINNLLYWFRPDLTVIFTTPKTTIDSFPAYGRQAMRNFVNYAKRAPFIIDPPFKNTNPKISDLFLQYPCRSDNKIHYELIGGSQTEQKVPYKFFAEFHVENMTKASDSDLYKKLKQQLQQLLAKNPAVTFIPWNPGKNSFAIRCQNGVFILDRATGLPAPHDTVKEKLAEQMNLLYNTIETTVETTMNNKNDTQNKIESLLRASKQLVLTGAPGTGKTFTASAVARKIIEQFSGKPDQQLCFVQFHPGYDYSDFIIGLKPALIDENGNKLKDQMAFGHKVSVSFHWVDGIFKVFADRAKAARTANETLPFIILIDEINRADLSRVFGEVFSLLEEEYRYPNRVQGITLPNGESFILPDNLYIIATMNDIDRSVESMDFALRRRFSWYEIKAENSESIIDAQNSDSSYKITDMTNRTKLKNVMHKLNSYLGHWTKGNELNPPQKVKIGENEIALCLGDEYQLGGAYFLNFKKYQSYNSDEAMNLLWTNHLVIILSEYLRGNKQRSQILKQLYEEYSKTWQSENRQ